jgi:ankyrin repeat protein
MVRLLLDYGADVNVWGGEHGNALNAAKAKGHERTVQLLLSHGVVSDSGYEVPEWSTNTYGQISKRDQLPLSSSMNSCSIGLKVRRHTVALQRRRHHRTLHIVQSK